MVSPELLRRYAFFAGLNDNQQRALAQVAQELSCESGRTLFDEGQPVGALYFLLEGSIDLYYGTNGHSREQSLVCEISPGEPFGISALIEPYTLTATARVSEQSRILKIDAAPLRALCDTDPRMGYALMRQASRVAMERLHYARVQLAAAHH